MRLSALFFALYFACLSCLSCADELPVRQNQEQARVAAAHHAGCATDAPGDWCSPLCQCHCCGAAVVPVVAGAGITSSDLADWTSSPRHGRLLVPAPTRAPGTVWQPPQA